LRNLKMLDLSHNRLSEKVSLVPHGPIWWIFREKTTNSITISLGWNVADPNLH
jgi:hypothetical protein